MSRKQRLLSKSWNPKIFFNDGQNLSVSDEIFSVSEEKRLNNLQILSIARENFFDGQQILSDDEPFFSNDGVPGFVVGENLSNPPPFFFSFRDFSSRAEEKRSEGEPQNTASKALFHIFALPNCVLKAFSWCKARINLP